jgi:hypothetical protein
LPTRSRSGSEVGQAHQLVVQLVGVIPRISRARLPRLAGRELRITSAFHALVTGLNSAFTYGSQNADGGNRWLLMEIRGHLGARGHGVPARGAQDWPVLAGTPGRRVLGKASAAGSRQVRT